MNCEQINSVIVVVWVVWAVGRRSVHGPSMHEAITWFYDIEYRRRMVCIGTMSTRAFSVSIPTSIYCALAVCWMILFMQWLDIHANECNALDKSRLSSSIHFPWKSRTCGFFSYALLICTQFKCIILHAKYNFSSSDELHLIWIDVENYSNLGYAKKIQLSTITECFLPVAQEWWLLAAIYSKWRQS